MKLHKILMVALLFTGSVFTLSSTQAAPKSIITVLRVRTVPSSSDQKKKDNTAKQPTNGASTTKNCSQSKYVLSSLYIGNGGKPK
jgi:hypothetical protein